MKALLIQLSDIHITAKDSHFIDRAEKLADAATSRITNADEVHMVVTGDSANWGLKTEFELAEKFLRRVAARIESRTRINPRIIVIPGNHDCNFQGDQAVREILLKAVGVGSNAVSDSILGQLGCVLADFRDYQLRLCPEISQINAWHSEVRFGHVKYVIMNSALMSTIKEKPGSLQMELPHPQEDGHDGRTIYLMHHPYNWLQQDNARELAQHASAHADLFLMGHEHVAWGQSVRELYDGATITYLKAHVLHDTEDYDNSAFSTVVIDTDSGFLPESYRWNDGRFSYWQEQSSSDYIPWHKADSAKKISLLDVAYRELTNAGANFTHRKKSLITLPDIFVWPAIRSANIDVSTTKGGAIEATEFSAERISADYDSFSDIVVIRGGEQAGKSALAKVLSLSFSRKGIHPILLAAGHISSWREKSLNDRINGAIDSMYGRSQREDYQQLSPEFKVLIIDNFDLAEVARGYFEGLRALRKYFGKIILMLDSHPGLEMALTEFLNDECLVDAQVFDILEMNYSNRIELIERWIGIGDPDIDSQTLRVTAARLSKVVDETLGRNLIPAVPVFILIVLQRAETAQDLDTVVKSGSQGFLYESLIVQALSTKVQAMNVPTCLAYLTHLAQRLNHSSNDGLSQIAYEAFHVEHCSRFALDVPVARLQSQLIAAGIFDDRGGGVGFKYHFHKYYFIARSISLRDDWLLLEGEVDALIETIHTEKSANVLLFLSHIKRNSRVADKLIEKAESMFRGTAVADLFAKQRIIDDFDSSTVRALIREGSRSEQLNEHEKDLLDAETSQRELTAIAEARVKRRLDDAFSMNAAFKTLQVLGQILRNHAGEIERAEKLRITNACCELGLKTLAFMLTTVADYGPDIIAFRAAQLEAEKPGVDAAKITEELQNYLPGFASTLCVGSLIRIANAIGAEDLAPTLTESLGKSDTGRMIKLVTQLEHFSDFPKDELLKFEQEVLVRAAFLPNHVLRRFIIRRLYLFPARDELKRAVLDKFKIKALPFKFLEQRKPD
ncbi:metallophosphoesterase [Xanthomonas sontii]|uniref:STAND family AAA ATPase n=1 Tax=Xanthomonas sontii TaxID=2650745 RepID=UPI003F83D2DC